ncbi:MAG: hypothetical protein HY461_01660 [Parcubacteria group bacterium]|nr:hypothetical protein [Parcubacteria group bacterium]
MDVRLYEENEIHRCNTCGLTCRVTFAAVPIEPLQCCGQDMELVGVSATDEGLDLAPAPVQPAAKDKTYLPGEVYTCSICGLDVMILRQARPIEALDCCGEGMELR